MCRAREPAVWLACVLSILGQGCGGGADSWVANRPQVVAAEGLVKYSGDPLSGATVVFSPQGEKGVAASAVTDSDGHFQMMAFPPLKGAAPGQYKVSVTKIEMPAAPPAAKGAAAAHDETPTGPPKHLIPEKFGDPERSGLSADVPPEGKKNFLITIN